MTALYNYDTVSSGGHKSSAHLQVRYRFAFLQSRKEKAFFKGLSSTGADRLFSDTHSRFTTGIFE